MKFVFSRHAQRRIKLYKIKDEDVEKVVKNFLLENDFNAQHEVIEPALATTYKYPLKVVFTKEDELITIVTAYPLKKGM